MTEAKPIFNMDNLLFYREEKEGYWTITSKHHPEIRELVINKTTKNILDYCDGQRTINDITNILKKEFPTVSIKVFEKDVSNTLANFSRLMLIEWDGENPFLFKREEYFEDNYFFRVGQEEDIHGILNFIEANKEIGAKKIVYKNKFLREEDYVEIVLRHRIFNYAEEFFFLEKDDKIYGLISVILPTGSLSQAARIKLIICPIKYLKGLFRYPLDTLPHISISNVTKVRINHFTDEQLDEELLRTITDEGFTQECILSDEFGFGKHLQEMALTYDEKLMKKIESKRKRIMQ
jgi:hypothetical protein